MVARPPYYHVDLNHQTKHCTDNGFTVVGSTKRDDAMIAMLSTSSFGFIRTLLQCLFDRLVAQDDLLKCAGGRSIIRLIK